MNIFVLHLNPRLAAKYHNDKHVIKMLLETAQLLSTAHRLCNPVALIDDRVYKPTHINHPCSVWLRQSKANYLWLFSLFEQLEQQYERRYHKQHRSYITLHEVLRVIPVDLPDVGMTPFALAMPEQYKQKDPVEAYRAYYKGEKLAMSRWTYPSRAPAWLWT